MESLTDSAKILLTGVALLVLALAWLFAALRDPFKTFVLMIPLVALTRSVELPLVGPRIILFDALLLLWLVAVACRRLGGHRDLVLPPTSSLSALSYGVFLLACLASLLAGRSAAAGILVIAIYSYALVIGLVVAGLAWSEERIVLIVKALCWTLAGVAAISIAELLGLRVFSGTPHRLTGSFRNPNQLGAFIFIVTPFLLSILFIAKMRVRTKLAVAVLMGPVIFALLMTGSRTSIAVFGGQVVLLFLLVGWSRSGWRALRTAVMLLPIAGLLIWLAVFLLPQVEAGYSQAFTSRVVRSVDRLVQKRPNQTAVDSLADYVNSIRFLSSNWRLPFEAFAESPIIGVGAGNFELSYQILAGRRHEVHSQYLGVLAETGLVGFVSFMAFCGAILQVVLSLLTTRNVSRWLAVAIALSLICSLVSGVYVIFLRRREFWVILGLAWACLAASGNRWSISGKRFRLREFLIEKPDRS